jgi:hypothetical protein
LADTAPAAPTELAAYLRSGWGVILAFTDNSVDEEEFVAEISVVHDDGSTGPPVVIDRVPGSAAGETGGQVFRGIHVADWSHRLPGPGVECGGRVRTDQRSPRVAPAAELPEPWRGLLQ